MARVPNLELNDHPELKPVIAQILGPRADEYPDGLKKGNHLWKLYTVLLHNPEVAAGWSHLVTAVRSDVTIPKADQELAIVMMTFINQSRFEYNTHSRKGLEAGLTRQQLDALPIWRNAKELFSERQRAILAYAEAMTRSVVVPDEVFEPLRAIFNTKQLVELTALIAVYNLTMRFTVAMEMGE